MSEPKYGVIETGVPIPIGKKHGEFISLLSKLQVGESVLLEKGQANSARSTLSRLYGKFRTRTVDDGVRIWRVE